MAHCGSHRQSSFFVSFLVTLDFRTGNLTIPRFRVELKPYLRDQNLRVHSKDFIFVIITPSSWMEANIKWTGDPCKKLADVASDLLFSLTDGWFVSEANAHKCCASWTEKEIISLSFGKALSGAIQS